MRRHQIPAVSEHRKRAGSLNRRHRNALAERSGIVLDLPVGFNGRHKAVHFAWEGPDQAKGIVAAEFLTPPK